MHVHDIIIFTNSYFVAYTETESESLHHVRLLVYSLVYSGLKKKQHYCVAWRRKRWTVASTSEILSRCKSV